MPGLYTLLTRQVMDNATGEII